MTWTWRLSRPVPLASFDTSVYHAYDTDHRAACDPNKTVVESIRPPTDNSPRCGTCRDVTEEDDVCNDMLDQDGWLGHCAKRPNHEPPHAGMAVHAINSEVATLYWDYE